MQRRRARSAERREGRLVDLLERIAAGPRPARPAILFRTPQFDGKGNVEYFIQRIEEVARVNDWSNHAAVLHLREALEEDAEECGRTRTVHGIFTTLRARYGLSLREARARLGCLRKDIRTTLQEHAVEVQRLVAVAYDDLLEPHQAAMALEIFASTLGNAYLQRHFLAVDLVSIEAAIRAGNEFLQVKPWLSVPEPDMWSEE